MILQSFKLNARSKKIKTISLSLDDLEKLFEIIKEWNEEAKKLQTQSIFEEYEKDKDKYKEEDVKSLNERLLNLYTVAIEIIDSKGEFFRSYEPTEAFDKKKFPDNVISVRITNTILFDAQRELTQSYRITATFDFRKPTVFDLTSNNSFETANDSIIEVFGVKSGWTEGAFSKLEEFVNKRKNNRKWLHRRNIYGLFLWLCFAPIVLWNFYRVEGWIFSKSPDLSNVLLVIIYLYLFFIALLLLAIIFRFLRNLFPPIEIIEYQDNTKKFLRNIITSLLSLIVLEQLAELFYSLISLLL